MTSSAPEVTERADLSQSLHALLETAEEITILCHNNPDPDCLASALALGRIAADAGIDERRILYSGSISHQQNRAFVNLLEIDLQPYVSGTVSERPTGSLLAFVDHAVPGANNEVPAGTSVDVVIDHHQAETIDARFVDHREDVGATSTILTEYVRALDVDLDATLATALLFAIRRETLGFLRGTTRAEYYAAAVLNEHADSDLLRRLSSPSVSGATVDAIADAIENRTVRASVLISNVGRTRVRDALPQAADYLATLEGVQTAVVFGIVGDAIEISARSTDSRVNVGRALQEAFGHFGSAGGHRNMGGGAIPLGIFAEYSIDEDDFVDFIEQLITKRLAKVLRLSEDDGTRGSDADEDEEK